MLRFEGFLVGFEKLFGEGGNDDDVSRESIANNDRQNRGYEQDTRVFHFTLLRSKKPRVSDHGGSYLSRVQRKFNYLTTTSSTLSTYFNMTSTFRPFTILILLPT